MAATRHAGTKTVLGRNPASELRRFHWCLILLGLSILAAGCGAPGGQPLVSEPARQVTETASALPREPSVLPAATAAAPTETATPVLTPVSPTAIQTIPATVEKPVQTAFPTATLLRSPTPALRSTLTAQDVQRITPADAKALLDAGEAILYDVRSANEYATLHASGAISFPDSQAAARLGELQADKSLVFY